MSPHYVQLHAAQPRKKKQKNELGILIYIFFCFFSPFFCTAKKSYGGMRSRPSGCYALLGSALPSSVTAAANVSAGRNAAQHRFAVQCYQNGNSVSVWGVRAAALASSLPSFPFGGVSRVVVLAVVLRLLFVPRGGGVRRRGRRAVCLAALSSSSGVCRPRAVSSVPVASRRACLGGVVPAVGRSCRRWSSCRASRRCCSCAGGSLVGRRALLLGVRRPAGIARL